MELIVIGLCIIILLIILVSNSLSIETQAEKYQPDDLVNYIINLILYTPLDTSTLVKIVNRYQDENERVYKKNFKDVIGFLRFTKETRFKENFIKEAKRYLTQKDLNNEDIFTEDNLKFFVDGINSEIRAIQVQEDDLD